MTNLPQIKSHRILVVDDDDMLNELLCDFLRNKNFETCSAYSVQDAKQLLKVDQCIDLVLLDYELGDGNGLELLMELNSNAALEVPPVIMISVNEDSDFLQSCFSCGVADYIIKPVNLSLLALKVAALIKSVTLQQVISRQNYELARFKQEAEREEAVAKFTYEYLLGQNSQPVNGVDIWLKASSSFSGDIALAKTSPSGDLYFMLADATGHGLSAAITIMPAVSIFNSMVSKGFHIQPIVTELNRKLIRDTPHDRFVAAIIVQIQKDQNEMHVWNGGMPTAYWVNDGEILQRFRSRHMALGILDDDMFDSNTETYRFSNEGFIFACSDGLLEENDDRDECFSEGKLIDIIKSKPQNLHQALVSSLQNHAGRDSYRDDVSICTLTPGKMLLGSSRLIASSALSRQLETSIGDFSWSVKLSGRKIEKCEVPPLVNKFLQYVGVNQQVCQIVFLVVSEMVSNAIDHGLLRLESAIKEKMDGFDFYFRERERRLSYLTDMDTIELVLEWKAHQEHPQLIISVRDSGLGYDLNSLAGSPDNQLFGRGLHLIRSLAQSVEVEPPGNFIKAVISSM